MAYGYKWFALAYKYYIIVVFAIHLFYFVAAVVITCAKAEIMRSGLFVCLCMGIVGSYSTEGRSVRLSFCLSVCLCAASHKKLCMNFFSKGGVLTHCQGDFILEVIQTDLHCHLEATVAQQVK